MHHSRWKWGCAVAALAGALGVFNGCGKNVGIEFSGGGPGKIKAVSLPAPKAPSQVFGIGEAMAAGQDILLFRPARKASALPDDERNYYFIGKLMESYAPRVKVIELTTAVSYPQGDYFADILDNFHANGYGVIKKENGGYKLYKVKFGYSENYDAFVVPIQRNLETMLGPSSYDKRKLISPESRFEAYNRAMREGRNLIICNFAGACGSFPPAEQAALRQKIQAAFSGEAEILDLDYTAYTDPATELYSTCRNMVSVYNSRTKRISPALFSRGDTLATIRRLLAEK
ncbi:MAG: hypothetical protein WC708_15245 [Lentisphaeria bacterium]